VSLRELKEEIERYEPYNEQEKQDRELMLEYIDSFSNVLTRDNRFGHFTASAWVLNKQKTKVLMVYHNIYKSWVWTGGHSDGESDLLKVAIRELKEETGVKNVVVIKDDIFSLEVFAVRGHTKGDKYIPSHAHLNLTYLLEADEDELLHIKEDENSGVKWVRIEDVKEVTDEGRWNRTYKKIDEKLRRFL